MRKEDFIKLGADETLAQKLADASAEELKGFIPKTRFDEVNGELKQSRDAVKERDGQLETLRNSAGDVEALKKQIETLQVDNKTKDDTHAAELHKVKVDSALERALIGASAKNPLTVRPLLNLDKPVLQDDGTIKGLTEQLKTLAEAEDTKFLFNTETTGQNQFKGFVPGEKSDKQADNDPFLAGFGEKY